MIFIIQGFRNIVIILIAIFTTFRSIFPPVFSRHFLKHLMKTIVRKLRMIKIEKSSLLALKKIAIKTNALSKNKFTILCNLQVNFKISTEIILAIWMNPHQTHTYIHTYIHTYTHTHICSLFFSFFPSSLTIYLFLYLFFSFFTTICPFLFSFSPSFSVICPFCLICSFHSFHPTICFLFFSFFLSFSPNPPPSLTASCPLLLLIFISFLLPNHLLLLFAEMCRFFFCLVFVFALLNVVVFSL